MNKRMQCAAWLLFLVGSTTCITLHANVTAYGLLRNPFVGRVDGATLCYLDKAQQVQQRVNRAIKSLGKNEATLWLKAHPRLMKDYMAGATCLLLARRDNITKLPAIVKNHRCVVYGIVDLMRASSLMQTKNCSSLPTDITGGH